MISITYKNGLYRAKRDRSSTLKDKKPSELKKLLEEENWRWRKNLKSFITSDIKKVVPFAVYCEGEAKKRLLAFMEKKEKATAASWKTDSDIEIPSPKDLEYMGFQKAFVEYAKDREYVLLGDQPGLGKSLSLDCPVLTLDGWVPMGNIEVGDFVIGQNGKTTKVTGVFPQGKRDIYKVIFRDGTWCECCDEHLWAVKDCNRRKRRQDWTVKTLKELMDRGIHYKNGKNKWSIPLVNPIEFTKKVFDIDPYILGVFIGNGHFGDSIQLTVSKQDEDIYNLLLSRLNSQYRWTRQESSGCFRVYPRKKKYDGVNNYRRNLQILELDVQSRDKFIPEIYKFGSIQQRIDLLAGLMDTDGSCSRNRTTFHTTSPKLADDVCDLVRSLGGVAILRRYDRTREKKPIEYQVNVKTFFNPFYSKRKGKNWKYSEKNGPRKFIKDVQYIGKKKSVCISVDSPDKLYVTKDFIVTHNTIQGIALSNYKSYKKILVICPASIKKNWKREWEKWCVSGLSVGIVETDKEKYKDEEGKTKYRTVDVYPDADVIIINRHLLDRHLDKIHDVDWDLILVDEAHDYRTKEAVSTQMVYGIGEDHIPIPCKQHIDMTGTPIMTKPFDLWPKLLRFDKYGLGKSFWAFTKRYCAGHREFGDYGNYIYNGFSNEEELGEYLRSNFMIRRIKKDVLKDLPPKRHQIIELPSKGLQRLIAEEQNVVRQNLMAFESLIGLVDEDTSDLEDYELKFEYLEGDNYEQQSKKLSTDDIDIAEQVSTARKNLALAKLKMVKEHVDTFLESGEKVVLFVHHKDVAKDLKEYYPEAAYITGAVPQSKRQPEVDKFQEDPNCKLLIGNILAAGVGFTMTAASTVIFAELSWIPSDLEQAEDRLWRIGQMNAVNVQHLVVENSLDSIMVRKLIRRQKQIRESLNTDSIFEMSRGEYRKVVDQLAA